ncbi:uncharacterized protein ACA1_112830 [Acanthamoeba castellanii str. Neff]|uniref:RFX-type winged-helix domain-containing protein n=1 Tax=Acanthamoeba castellanii (strain ATCC 30010 / Neff) TaxID=1257118 RepID=L8H5H1_ACACF|nr:uncharacterized protein ACA1_112830 [Acanthamoeba castellanii str. Neff]ELR19978.1 hypothetical protein ACA1_112830 [Acanthamoeba castellanii str. Neff]
MVPRGDTSDLIFAWLTNNFEERFGSILSREEAYDPYVAHCERMHYEHTTLAVFAKLFKEAFPGVLTRRLVRGRDGQKRCYVGVAFRPRPGSDLAPPRWPRPASAPAPTITWVEENRAMRPDAGAGRKRARDLGGGVTSVSSTNQHPPLATTGSCTTAVTPTSDDGDDAAHCYDEEEAEVRQDVEHYQEEVVAVGRTGAHLEPTAVLEYLVQLYVKELWGINPINPATTDIETLRTGVGSEEESSSLTLASCLLMSSTSFLAGHWQLAKHYFYLARRHLGELFDIPDYDVACALFPLAWWSRLYANNYEEGLSKQSYYLTVGKQICESVDAQNDETYRSFTYVGGEWALTSLLLRHYQHQLQPREEDPSEIIAASKLREPYRRKWKPVRGLTHARPDTATSIEIRQLVGQMYCDVHPICAFYQENGWNHPGWVERKEILKENLGTVNELEEKLVAEIRGDRSCTLMYTMMLCEVCALRMFIYWALQSGQHVYAAKKFVQLLLEVDILVKANERQLLAQWYTTQLTHAKSFYWMHHMCQYIQQHPH